MIFDGVILKSMSWTTSFLATCSQTNSVISKAHGAASLDFITNLLMGLWWQLIYYSIFHALLASFLWS